MVQGDPTHPGWAYVVGGTHCIGFCPYNQNLSRTQDGGKTWANATPGPDPSVSYLTAGLLAVAPNSGDVVEAVGSSALIYRNGEFV